MLSQFHRLKECVLKTAASCPVLLDTACNSALRTHPAAAFQICETLNALSHSDPSQPLNHFTMRT